MHISVDMTTYILCSCKLACYRFHTNIHIRDYCHPLCVAQHVMQSYGNGILYADFNWYVLMFLLLSFIHPCKLSCELNCDNWGRQSSPAGYDLFHPCLCHQCAVPACVWLVSSLFTFTACCQDLLSRSCLIPMWCHGELPRAPVYDLFHPCHCVLHVHCVLPRPVGMSCLAPVRLQSMLPRFTGYELSCLCLPLRCMAQACGVWVVSHISVMTCCPGLPGTFFVPVHHHCLLGSRSISGSSSSRSSSSISTNSNSSSSSNSACAQIIRVAHSSWKSSCYADACFAWSLLFGWCFLKLFLKMLWPVRSFFHTGLFHGFFPFCCSPVGYVFGFLWYCRICRVGLFRVCCSIFFYPYTVA